MAAEYFRSQTEQIADATFQEIETLNAWTSRRVEYRRQLLEMLGLDPFPDSTPLQPVVTGRSEKDGVVVENVQFQSMPGLYVTGNFYRPATQTDPLPAILYVCGHGREMDDGVSLGNKTHYQHHGAWFARNGYVCLVIDTIQLGEIEGIHHGTYRENMWWWNNRGYTPAGVEAFNCVRSIDYLQSRDEVDDNRIGVTGRSGGGAYSWWISAIDDRIKVAVPVAGITNLKNHVVDGCVEGHCDCMYMVNTYRWDYAKVAALVAPRPLLICNSDSDRIFPLDGVVDLHSKVRRIYELYGAADQLGLHITQGSHKDTQELRMGAFRWFNRFLKSDESLIEDAARPMFDRRQLKVFKEIPNDERVSTIHESFVPKVEAGNQSLRSDQEIDRLKVNLRQKTFRGWPEEACDLAIVEVTGDDARPDCRAFEYTSQEPYRLSVLLIGDLNDSAASTKVTVLDHVGYRKLSPVLAHLFPDQFPGVQSDASRVADVIDKSSSHNVVFLLPRDVGPTRTNENEKSRIHMRRRYMLLGQTLAGMQIYDVCRGLTALRQFDGLESSSFTVGGDRDAAVWAAYASLMTEGVGYFRGANLPKSNRKAPDLLNVSKLVELQDIQQIVESKNTP